jgi:hypothetical protein
LQSLHTPLGLRRHTPLFASQHLRALGLLSNRLGIGPQGFRTLAVIASSRGGHGFRQVCQPLGSLLLFVGSDRCGGCRGLRLGQMLLRLHRILL